MNGERLRVAREACWLTQADLAKRSGIPASTISKIEKGMYGQTADGFVGKFAAALGMPPSYFSNDPMPDVPDGRFRKQARASAKLQKSVIAHSKQIAAVMDQADRRYRILKPTFAPLENGTDLSKTGELANYLRKALGLGTSGPVSNMTRACERAGIAVVNVPLFENRESARGSEDERVFSGFSTWPGMGFGSTSRPIVLLSSSLPGGVQRASLAHELAHIYIHTRNTDVDVREAERQAWMVGGDVLLPEGDARDMLDGAPVTLDRLRMVKARYGVTVKFLITYCSRHGIVSEKRATSLHKQYSSRKWGVQEPVTVARESSQLFPKVLMRMRADGIDVGMNELDVAHLCAEIANAKVRQRTQGKVLSLK